MPPLPNPGESLPFLVIGGAGFIGSNLAASFAEDGERVIIFDNLSRPGVERNLAWLERQHPERITRIIGDVRDQTALDSAVKGVKGVFHLASQVAVTVSLNDPVNDFHVNALGTLQVLEAVRRHSRDTPVVFASTNKVYGNLADLPLELSDGRYFPLDPEIRTFGINEDRPLDFCTPYGCSKGSADQYVLDYAKSFGMRTAVLRMSCIYGPRQFGTEDQGWVAHFLINALRDEPITLYGDGQQVRDVLHVHDAVEAYKAVFTALETESPPISGKAFNLGGGFDNAVSLNQILAAITGLVGYEPEIRKEDWRQGDQLYFVADTRRLSAALRWRVTKNWRDGLSDLYDWVWTELNFPPAKDRTRLTA